MLNALIPPEIFQDLSAFFKNPGEALRDLFKYQHNIDINSDLLIRNINEITTFSELKSIVLSDGRKFVIEGLALSFPPKLKFLLIEQKGT